MSDWIAAAASHLARLRNPHREKKRATVIALVDARLAGKSEETVWDRAVHPNVCARSVYHGKWKKDSLFVEVLEAVTTLAQEWNDTEELRAMDEAVRKLRLATPAVADQLVSMATTGRVRRIVRDSSGAPAVVYEPAGAGDVRLAAMAILDRAGMETAAKSEAKVDDGVRIIIDR